jgi:hypothetical protein
MSTAVEDRAFFFLLRVAMLARDSIVYFIVIFGLCTSIGGLLVLTPTIRYFLACLVMNIVENTDYNVTFSIST